MKSIVAAAVGVALVTALTACGSTVPKQGEVSKDPKDSASVVSALNDAKKINVHKAVFSWGDSWTVTADDVEVAEIHGQAVAVLGDTYNMYSKKGNLVGSEAEKVFKLLPGAVFYDDQNKPRGSMNQDLSVFLQKFTMLDVKNKTVATAEQNLNLTLNFDIKDAKGATQYKVSKAFFSWGDSLDLERVSKDAKVSGLDAVWFAVIANELNAAKNDDSGSHKKK